MEEIEIRTEAINELLSAVPKWILRWGISIVFAIIILLLTLSFFIKYPDRLSAKAIITTTHPPITLISKTNGEIAEFKVINNQSVRQGEVLLVIDNSTNYQSLIKIAGLIDTLNSKFKKGILPEIKLDSSLKLGDLAPTFITFLKSYQDYKLQLNANPQQKEINLINKILLEYKLLQDTYQNQEILYKEESTLVEQNYLLSQKLLQDTSIPPQEYENKKREYLSIKRAHEKAKVANLDNKIVIHDLYKNKLQLENLSYQQNKQYEQALTHSILALKSEIDRWEQTYLIKAPIDGTVSLFNYWNIHQNLKQGDSVLSIVPIEKQSIIAKLFLPVKNSGKLKIGQTVNIKLENYPYQEYGTLQGSVKGFSKVPHNETYVIEAPIPNNLITSHRKSLEYKEGMQGWADIVTEELSIFDRIFYQLTKLIKK